MSIFKSTIVVGALLLSSGCAALTAPTTKTLEPNAPSADLGRMPQTDSPRNVDRSARDLSVYERPAPVDRERYFVRRSDECWKCR